MATTVPLPPVPLPPVQIFQDKILGEGAYGKVCKAKYGHLPCAAKLLHGTMLEEGNEGIDEVAKRFKTECQVLSMIRHPNIVQYLTTYRDPQSQSLALIMEQMDESLTKLLHRSTHPLPYCTQINICHDVALALSYLHSIAVIHRDLSSNNVLIFGNGRRVKVADFGMLKLNDINPRMKKQDTICPGSLYYMPPEALIVPSNYSNKLDCFSFGVLSIQIATREFPKPTSDRKAIDDPNYPTGSIFMNVPEIERRKNQIDLIEPDHPLLTIALQCLEDKDANRPSADEIYERVEKIGQKLDEKYTLSPVKEPELEQIEKDLFAQLQLKSNILHKERADHLIELKSKTDFIDHLQKEIGQKSSDLEDHQTELNLKKHIIANLGEKNYNLEEEKKRLLKEKNDCQTELKEKNDVIDDLRINLEEKSKLLLEERENHQTKLKGNDDAIIQLQNKIKTDLNEAKEHLLKERADYETELKEKVAKLQTEMAQTKSELEKKNELLVNERVDHQTKLKRKEDEDEHQKNIILADYDMKIKEKNDLIADLQIEIALNNDDLEKQKRLQIKERADYEAEQKAKDDIIADFEMELKKRNSDLENKSKILNEKDKLLREERADHQAELERKNVIIAELKRKLDSSKLTQDMPIKQWKTGAQPPAVMKNGVAYGSKAYFSNGSQIYLYAVAEKKWVQIEPLHEYFCFAMAIIDGYLVTIGGERPDGLGTTKTNILFSLLPDRNHKSIWKKALPKMHTKRKNATAVTTHTHLVVAGGEMDNTIEVLDMTTYKWSLLRAQLLAANFIQLKVCGERLYLLRSPSMYSCSLEELFRCKGDCSSLWTKHADAPQALNSTLVTMKDSILAIGGEHQDKPTNAIQRYDETSNSWSVIETLPCCLKKAAAVVLSTNELIIADHLTLRIGTDIF